MKRFSRSLSAVLLIASTGLLSGCKVWYGLNDLKRGDVYVLNSDEFDWVRVMYPPDSEEAKNSMRGYERGIVFRCHDPGKHLLLPAFDLPGYRETGYYLGPGEFSLYVIGKGPSRPVEAERVGPDVEQFLEEHRVPRQEPSP